MTKWRCFGRSAVCETAVRAACSRRYYPATFVVRQIRATGRLLARYPGLGRETNIPGVRVFPTARYPYLVYHRIHEDELVIIHIRDGRRDTPEANEL